MFTGLVEETGQIRSVRQSGRSLHLAVGAEATMAGMRIGDSIAVNGVCLTVVQLGSDSFTTDVMPETFEKTNLRGLPIGAAVNLERTMAVGDRFGGHIMQGHVDGMGTIRSIQEDEIAWWVTVAAPPEILRYIVPKGSIAIDGISLTVADLTAGGFRVSLIPHTRSVTNMKDRRAGDSVNLEVDILAKYVERMINARLDGGAVSQITEAFLKEHGFSK